MNTGKDPRIFANRPITQIDILVTLAVLVVSSFTLFAQPAPAPDLTNNPAYAAPVRNPALPAIFIAGDSTAARGAGARQQGWGVPFADYFDTAKVTVINRARGGRSSRTFVSEGLWDQMLGQVKAGDIVLIQFGHNDGGAVNDASRARGSIPGLGEESREIDNLVTKKHEVVRTFGWYMRKMIADTKAKGATPIAKAAVVPFVDLNNQMADKFDALGEERMKALYPQDHTHFNAEGADLHAAAVVSGLKALHPNPVEKYLSAKSVAMEAKP
jgi:lysophospholipase L1-like esterase